MKNTTFFHLLVSMALIHRNQAVFHCCMLIQIESVMINMDYFTTIT